MFIVSTSAGRSTVWLRSIEIERSTASRLSGCPVSTMTSSSSSNESMISSSPAGPANVISLPRTCVSTSGNWRSMVRSSSSRAPSRVTISIGGGICRVSTGASPPVLPPAACWVPSGLSVSDGRGCASFIVGTSLRGAARAPHHELCEVPALLDAGRLVDVHHVARLVVGVLVVREPVGGQLQVGHDVLGREVRRRTVVVAVGDVHLEARDLLVVQVAAVAELVPHVVVPGRGVRAGDGVVGRVGVHVLGDGGRRRT